METARSKLTVLFDPPFWVGIFEREHGGQYEACKVTFGTEPRDFEVYQLVLEDYVQLTFSPAIAVPDGTERSLNPKRARRLARQETQQTGTGTKAQQALQLQRERDGIRRKTVSRQAREARQERQYQLRREKRKEKHRGR